MSKQERTDRRTALRRVAHRLAAESIEHAMLQSGLNGNVALGDSILREMRKLAQQHRAKGEAS